MVVLTFLLTKRGNISTFILTAFVVGCSVSILCGVGPMSEAKRPEPLGSGFAILMGKKLRGGSMLN